MNRIAEIRSLIHRQKKILPKKRFAIPTGIKDLQRKYLQNLLDFLNLFNSDFTRSWHLITQLGMARHDSDFRNDDWADEINKLFESLKRASLSSRRIAEDIARNNIQGIDSRNRQNFLKMMREALGVNIFDSADTTAIVKLAIQGNVSLITSIPNKYLDEVERVVLQNFQRGVRAEDFQDEIEERYGVAESRAALIARDQTSKLNGALTQARQTSIGIDAYFWRTSRDERVRDSHRALEGQRILWADPPEVGHPGEDFNCRCHPDPDVSEILQ